MSQNNEKLRVQAQLDNNLAVTGNHILKNLGLTPTSFITMAYQQLVNDQALPFVPHLNSQIKQLFKTVQITNKLYYRNLLTDEDDFWSKFHSQLNESRLRDSVMKDQELDLNRSTDDTFSQAVLQIENRFKQNEALNQLTLHFENISDEYLIPLKLHDFLVELDVPLALLLVQPVQNTLDDLDIIIYVLDEKPWNINYKLHQFKHLVQHGAEL